MLKENQRQLVESDASKDLQHQFNKLSLKDTQKKNRKVEKELQSGKQEILRLTARLKIEKYDSERLHEKIQGLERVIVQKDLALLDKEMIQSQELKKP